MFRTAALFAKLKKHPYKPHKKDPNYQYWPKKRKLLRDMGVKALLPSLHHKYKDQQHIDIQQLSVKERTWNPPKISKRVAAILRKEAIRNGTYGNWCPETLTGWDPEWDAQIAIATRQGTGRYMSLRKPKLTSRTRTREARAQAIDEKLKDMDLKMEEYHANRHRNKGKKKGFLEFWKDFHKNVESY